MTLKFVLLLIVVKIIYLFFESKYNIDVLNFNTDISKQIQDFRDLEIVGHNLSSVGITILLLPFFYKILKKFIKKEGIVYITTFIFCAFSYQIIYHGLNNMFEKIVEMNRDKRYEAFYASMLKYGIMSGFFGYEKYMPKDIGNTVTHKVMLTNIFLLTLADDNLVDRIRRDGQKLGGNLLLSISKEYNNTLTLRETQFQKAAIDIKTAWEKYEQAKKDINKKIIQTANDSEHQANKEYKKFEKEINSKFDEYINAQKEYDLAIKTHSQKIDQYYNDLKKYFKYKGIKKAEDKYKKAMYSSFGTYVNPDIWCRGSVCPDKNAIASGIIKLANEKWYKESNGIDRGLDQREFLKKIRPDVILELRKRGLDAPNNFNYSKAMFVEAYNKSVSKNINIGYTKAIHQIQDEFRKYGIENISLNLNKMDFIRQFEPSIIREMGSIKYGKIATNIIISEKLGDFKDKIYIPMSMENSKMRFFSRQEFQNDKDASRYGDDAIKMLYIPPLALGMSIITGFINLLSLITLIGMLPFYRFNSLKANLIKTSVSFTFVIVGLMLVNINAKKREYFNGNIIVSNLKMKSPILYTYVRMLESVIYLEELNYSIASK